MEDFGKGLQSRVMPSLITTNLLNADSHSLRNLAWNMLLMSRQISGASYLLAVAGSLAVGCIHSRMARSSGRLSWRTLAISLAVVHCNDDFARMSDGL